MLFLGHQHPISSHNFSNNLVFVGVLLVLGIYYVYILRYRGSMPDASMVIGSMVLT